MSAYLVTCYEPHPTGPLVAGTHDVSTEQAANSEARFWIMFGEDRTASILNRRTGEVTDVDSDLCLRVRQQEKQGALF